MSQNFSLRELTRTETGLPNQPSNNAMANLVVLAEALEKVRTALGGNTVHVDSAYRSPDVNAAIGGAVHSAHMAGLAADIVCPRFGTPEQVALAIIDSGILFDQVILEKTWVHFAVGGSMRKMVLTCVAPGKYLPGLHVGRAV